MLRQLSRIASADPTLNRVQDAVAAVLNPALRSLDTLLVPIAEIQAPALLNSWTNLDGVFRRAGFYLDRGRVYFCGTVTNTPGTLANVVILALPVGYRTGGRASFTVNSSGGLRRVDITSDGNVFPTAAVTAGDFITLDGISFRAEA
jgi:hypothetical protein